VRRSWFFFFVLLVGVVAAAQQPSSSSTGPSVHVSFPNTLHKVRAEDICAVDFPNIRLERYAGRARQLNKGKYDYQGTDGFESVSLDDVHCLDVQGGVRYAVVESTWTYGHGSSNNDCVIQLFTLRFGYPVVVQQFDFDCHALSTGSTFDSTSKKLTIRARTDDDSPHCCAKSLDVVTYVWRDDRFESQGFRRVPAKVEKDADGLVSH
jgi:hypothetical protein